MNSDAQTGLRINNLALAETTYLFVDLALQVCQFTEPRPVTLNFQLGLESTAWQGRPCSLSTALIPDILG